MFKSFKKIVSVVAALGLLATSYVTVLAAPKMVFDWNIDNYEKLTNNLPNNLCKYVQGNVTTTPTYSKGKFYKPNTDACVEVQAMSNSYFDFAQTGGNSIEYTAAGYGKGSTVLCSVDFAFETEGKVPGLIVQGTRDGTNAVNLYVNSLTLSEVPTIEKEEWHNLKMAIKINSADKTVPSDVTIWIDGTQVADGQVMPNNAVRHMFTRIRLTNPSTDGKNTMYLDNAKVNIYTPNEFETIRDQIVKLDVPYFTITANDATLLYPQGIYTKDPEDTVVQLTGAVGKGSLVQLQDISNLPAIGVGNRVEFSFDVALQSITVNAEGTAANDKKRDLYVLLMTTNGQNTFRDSNNTIQNYGFGFVDGKVEFYGQTTDKTINAGTWYNCKVTYDIISSTRAKATIYIDNVKVAEDTLIAPYIINKINYMRYTNNAASTIYLDNIDIDVSDFTVPAVTATAGNQTQDGVNYMTWDAEPENVEAEEITDCGFAFVNTTTLEEAGDTIVWQESTKREDGTFGAAIAQDPNATGSSIYAIPYIAGQGFAKLGTAVRSIFK